MKNTIIFCFIIFLIACSKEKKELDIKEAYPEQINTVSIDDMEAEKPEETFYTVILPYY